MKTRLYLTLVAVSPALVVPLALPSRLYAAPTTICVSAGAGGAPANKGSNIPSMSADGRYVVFTSEASNLVPDDTNNVQDVFVRDMVAGTISRVSVASNGTQADSSCGYPSISADGRYVTFQSAASNLVPGGSNYYFQIFVRDTVAGTTKLVSIAYNGLRANNGHCFYSSITADGRYVAFTSNADNLVPGDTNGYDVGDVFVRDMVAGTTTRVSVASDGTQGNQASGGSLIRISPDGRYVVFDSYASNLVPGDTNGKRDVFVRDIVEGTTTRVSVATDGTQANDDAYAPTMSNDGRYIAFQTGAYNLVPGGTNHMLHVFVRDMVAGTMQQVSVATDGTQANGINWSPSISLDGRYIAFASDGSNLVPGDTNGKRDVFVRDRVAGTTTRVSLTYDGQQANNLCDQPSISADGRFVAFLAKDSNLVPGDTNGFTDAFLRGPLLVTAQPFSSADIVDVMRLVAGLPGSGTPDPARFDVTAPSGVDIGDAVAIARKVAGADANP